MGIIGKGAHLHGVINFLPWRVEQKRKAQRRFVLLFIILVSLFLMLQFSIHHHYEQQLSSSQKQLDELSSQWNKRQKQIQSLNIPTDLSKPLQNHAIALAELDRQSEHPIHVLRSISLSITDGVYLEKLELRDEIIHLSGLGSEIFQIDQFMAQLRQQTALSHIRLDTLSSDKTQIRNHHFTITALLHERVGE